MHRFGLTQYKRLHNKSNQERLTEGLKSQHYSSDQQRIFRLLPRKTMFQANFSNQRLNNALRNSQLSAPCSKKSSESKHPKTFSFAISPKNNKHQNRMSFDDFVTSKNAFRKILKHHSIKSEKRIKDKAMIWNKTPINKMIKKNMTQIDQFTFQMKKCLKLSAENAIRKNYHQKFENTRLIFQQQEKMKKIQRINKIYERKNEAFGKINKSEDFHELIKVRKCRKSSKWVKQPEKHEIYQISENGQECDKTL